MSLLLIGMQGLQELQNKSLLTRRTQNEEVHRSEINLEITRIERRNSPDIYCNGCIFIGHKETLTENYNLPSSSFYYLYLLFKIKLFNFFKILKRRSTHLVLPSYVVVRKNPVSISLFMLKGVKSTVSLTRNKLKMFLFLTRCCCVASFTLFICVPSVCFLSFSFKNGVFRSVSGEFSELWRMFCLNLFRSSSVTLYSIYDS